MVGCPEMPPTPSLHPSPPAGFLPFLPDPALMHSSRSFPSVAAPHAFIGFGLLLFGKLSM